MSNESFTRWQGRTIEEFGKTLNLLLAICIATFGFIISIITNKDFGFNSATYSKIVVLLCLFVFLSAISIALFISYNRLLSFRLTTTIARKRERNQRQNIENLRAQATNRDKASWQLFNAFLLLFVVGYALAIIFFILQFNLLCFQN